MLSEKAKLTLRTLEQAIQEGKLQSVHSRGYLFDLRLHHLQVLVSADGVYIVEVLWKGQTYFCLHGGLSSAQREECHAFMKELRRILESYFGNPDTECESFLSKVLTGSPTPIQRTEKTDPPETLKATLTRTLRSVNSVETMHRIVKAVQLEKSEKYDELINEFATLLSEVIETHQTKSQPDIQ